MRDCALFVNGDRPLGGPGLNRQFWFVQSEKTVLFCLYHGVLSLGIKLTKSSFITFFYFLSFNQKINKKAKIQLKLNLFYLNHIIHKI